MLLAVLCASRCITLPAAERYAGLAYARNGDQLLYREMHWHYSAAGVGEAVVLYECPQGAPFARKHLVESPSASAPDFDFQDDRDGYREGVETVDGRREVYVQDRRDAAVQRRVLPSDPAGVIDAGFDTFVRSHWSTLSAGSPLTIPFLVPSRFRFLNLKLSTASQTTLEEQPATQLHMGLSAWYGFAAPGFELTYDRAGQRLLRFEGMGTVRDTGGHNQDVRIVFPAADRASSVPDQEVSAALAATLVSTCSASGSASAAPAATYRSAWPMHNGLP